MQGTRLSCRASWRQTDHCAVKQVDLCCTAKPTATPPPRREETIAAADGILLSGCRHSGSERPRGCNGQVLQHRGAGRPGRSTSASEHAVTPPQLDGAHRSEAVGPRRRPEPAQTIPPNAWNQAGRLGTPWPAGRYRQLPHHLRRHPDVDVRRSGRSQADWVDQARQQVALEASEHCCSGQYPSDRFRPRILSSGAQRFH